MLVSYYKHHKLYTSTNIFLVLNYKKILISIFNPFLADAPNLSLLQTVRLLTWEKQDSYFKVGSRFLLKLQWL